jgi:hypothetical protein
MKIKTWVMAIICIVSIFGSVAASSAFGLWKTTADKIPAKYTSGEASGEYNPLDIKGSYDFATISRVFEIPLADLGIAYGVPDDPALGSFQVKTLEEIWSSVSTDSREIGTDSVRFFVAFYKGTPMEFVDTVGIPGAAVDLLLAKGKPTEEQKNFMASHRVDDTPVVSEKTNTNSIETTKDSSAAVVSEHVVKGATTWREVLDWGVAKTDLEALLGSPISSESMLIKDDCAAKGIEFSTIKSKIQSLIDAVK